MQRLIEDLLGFSLVVRQGGATVDVDMAEALAEAVSNVDAAVADFGAGITRGELPVGTGERALLVQLLQNLVGNALKFRSPGRAPEVRVEAQLVEDSGEFVCRDSGIGIDLQSAEQAFEKIVELADGHIWIDADRGDVLMTQEAFEENTVANRLSVVSDGVSVLRSIPVMVLTTSETKENVVRQIDEFFVTVVRLPGR